MFMPTDSAAEIEPVAIVFDADGTLLDSLPPHVAFCRAMNDKYACGLSLPDLSSSAGMEPQLHPQPQDSHDDAAHADPHADRGYDHNPDPAVAAGSLAAARALAAAPMDNFLRRAGFAEALVPALVGEYESSFAAAFPVMPFAGVPAMLRELAQLQRLNEQSARTVAQAQAAPGHGWPAVRIAVVSSNTSHNVRRGLDPVPQRGGSAPAVAVADAPDPGVAAGVCTLFECVRGIDNGPRDKTAAIAEVLQELGVPPARACYVGDTAKDCRCARAVHDRAVSGGDGDGGGGVSDKSRCYFIGAGYGFEDAADLADVVQEQYADDTRYKAYEGARMPAVAAAFGAPGGDGGGGGGGSGSGPASGARVARSVGELREMLLGWYEYMRACSEQQHH